MAAWPSGVGRVILDRTDSTNLEAHRRAAEAPVWVLARRQTAGKGRRGRGWEQSDGNFAASMICAPGGAPRDWPNHSFAAALALDDTLAELTGRRELCTLKWPNDVLLRGRKLAGILLESVESHLVIGIGVNLIAHPPAERLEEGALAPTNLMSETGVTVTAEAFLDTLAPGLHHWQDRLRRDGFAPVRTAWLDRAAGLGTTITARLPGRSLSGNFSGLAEDGALILDTAQGREVLPAAEVHFS